MKAFSSCLLAITCKSSRETVGRAPVIKERAYWEMDFPDRGEEDPGGDPRRLVDDFEEVMLKAVEKRLRADVPVGAYLSGGVDSSFIVALACHLKGPAINTYTIRVDAPELDELSAANLAARHIGAKPPIVQEFRAERRAGDLSPTDPGGGSSGDRYVMRGFVAAGAARSCLRPKGCSHRGRS